MDGASALAFRQPPPNPRAHLRKSPLTTSTTKKILPFIVRAEPTEEGSAEMSSPPVPTSPPGEFPAAAKESGGGFGVSIQTKKKGKQKRGPVIRREPLQKPSPNYSRKESSGGSSEADQTVNESAFLLTWLGLGLLILVEGLALASSGFLPESVDQLFSKYVYPVFTPTVFLFVAGTVAYGVFKYLQGESEKS